jgi:predicted ArsR family transcriptional regulator
MQNWTAMDLPMTEAGELAQPTRARLFALLGELQRPASTDELASRLQLHPNGVRVHLERLRSAGLLVRERERAARGRPPDRWSISPDARPGGQPPTAYADLGRWLVRAISATQTDLDDVEAAGREIGRDLATHQDSRRPETRMYDTLVALGFQPRREADEPDALQYRLGACPYRDVVRERQPVVCTLHRGITRGLLDGIDPQTTLENFVPKDPDQAGCLIQLSGPMAQEKPEAG